MEDTDSFEISPQFIQGLDYAEAYYHAPKGKLSVRWERTQAGISLRISVPEGMKGKLILPPGYALEDGAGERTLCGGNGPIELSVCG